MEIDISLVCKALDILVNRASDPERSREERLTYCSALDIITYALAGKEECLRQYDY